jgi:predicted amidohydrolase YtcJ
MTTDRSRLREAHAHLAAYGLEMSQLNLIACSSRGEALSQIARAADAARRSGRVDGRAGGWLVCGGLRPDGWQDNRWPTAIELEEACRGVPCVVGSFDHHALACNRTALDVAGIDRDTPEPADGRVAREGSGVPTGLFLEKASELVRRAVPAPTTAERVEHVRAALKSLHAMGFVEVHDMLAQPWLGPILAELSDQGELPCKVMLYAPVDEIIEFDRGADDWQREDVWLAGGKLFADGTLNSRTAWVLEPYADPLPGMPNGQVIHDRASIASAMATCRELGLGLAVHAIGDGAVRAVLDAWEGIVDGGGRDHIPEADTLDFEIPPLRIEHAELVDAADVPRFADLGVVCSVQPCHLLYDIEVLRRSLPHRLHRVLPLRELIQAGCTPGDLLWFGSDVPIVRPNPEDSIRAAVERRREGMEEAEAIGIGQRLTEREAWKAFSAPRD